jgi:NAD(P)-dependent dehydrogenase (short-subunit alcohol dehydrogenase family)
MTSTERRPLSAKVCVVTGGAGTLGGAIARRFVTDGALVMLADLDEETARAAADAIGAASRQVDVADQVSVEGLIDAAVERYGRLDVLVNNAGVLCPSARIHNQTANNWERAIAVNLLGVVYGMTAAIRVMRTQVSGGAIVNTGSVAALTAWSHSGPYGATKAAVVQLTKIAALEYATDGIRVNCVCPGLFDSAMLAGLPDEAVEAARARHPAGTGQAEDVVGAFAYLASDDARWTTGVALPVDGGYAVQ